MKYVLGVGFSNTISGITRTFTTRKICDENCIVQNRIRSITCDYAMFETSTFSKFSRTFYELVNQFQLHESKGFHECFSVKHEGLFKSDYPIWPPFRIPTYDHPQMVGVRRILHSGQLHHFLFLCLNAVCISHEFLIVDSSVLFYSI